MLAGALTALAGYLLPWFKQAPSYRWWYSGWEYASLSTGGGWTTTTIAWLLLAAGASLWAGRSVVAAMAGIVLGVGGLVSALAVVAASFGDIGERPHLNAVADTPTGIGLPLLAGGLGLLLAGAIRAIVRHQSPSPS